MHIKKFHLVCCMISFHTVTGKMSKRLSLRVNSQQTQNIYSQCPMSKSLVLYSVGIDNNNNNNNNLLNNIQTQNNP